MASLSSMIVSIARASTPNDSHPPTPVKKKQTPRTARRVRHLRQQKQKQQQAYSVIQIEQAIGAGSYRDYESGGTEEERNRVLDGVLMGNADEFEGPLEKKLRQLSQSFVARSESHFRSSGKTLLMIAFKWILPIWTLSLLLACRVFKLPVSLPLLDDLIM